MASKTTPSATTLEETSLLAAPEAFVSPSHAPEVMTRPADEDELRDTSEIELSDDSPGRELWGRWRLWEIPSFYHWSILGLCLSPSDLVDLVKKMHLVVPENLSNYEIYGLFIELARERGARGRLLHHTLDTKHSGVIEEFHLRASSEEQALDLWGVALASGDIPGAYWSLMTHPTTGPSAYQQAFRDLQMISLRLVAAGGAPLGWLQQLEQELRDAKEKHAVAEESLREQLRVKDARVAQLVEQLSRPRGSISTSPDEDEEVRAQDAEEELERLRAEVAGLEWRVVLESEWSKGNQTRSTGLVKEMQALKEKLASTEQENTVLRWAYKEAKEKLLRTSSSQPPSVEEPEEPEEPEESVEPEPRDTLKQFIDADTDPDKVS